MWAAFCPESLKWHDLAWTCFDLFFFILHSSVSLSFSHCKDIPDWCSGSPTPSSSSCSSSIYFSISPGAAGSCASIDSVGINKWLLLSDLKNKQTDLHIVWCCVFIQSFHMLYVYDSQLDNCWKRRPCILLFCHSYIFFFLQWLIF